LKKLYITILFFIVLGPLKVWAAPCGNFLGFFPEKSGETFMVFSMDADSQENTFPEQKRRERDISSYGEERHYSETRSSKIKFSYLGIKTGIALKNFPFMYVTAGYANADMDFSFRDDLTNTKSSYSLDTSFESDNFPVFGGGLSARIYRKQILGDKILNLGIDAQYRLLDFDKTFQTESEDAGKHEISYSSTMHEIQLSLEGSLGEFTWRPVSKISLDLTPYLGWKISHFIADETFADKGNINRAGEPDPIRYKDDIEVASHISAFAGVTIGLTDVMTLDIETRFGDEDGYTIYCSYKF